MEDCQPKIFVHRKQGANLPLYTTEGAAGADVTAHLEEATEIEPGERVLLSTGLFFEIPPGYELQVRPRSGLAYKHGVTVLNTPGTIDADYRGELKILLINHGKFPFRIEPGMRIAQIVVARCYQADFVVKEKVLSDTSRGDGGFGHTGMA